MDKRPTPSNDHALLQKETSLRIVVNGIHAKSGGGVTYLNNILPLLAKIKGVDLHLFIHKDQFDLFYPIDENVHVTLLTFKTSVIQTLLWEQLAIPLKSWAMGASVLFSPANYGPIIGRHNVILLRNAISVMTISQSSRQLIYWISLSAATLFSFIASRRVIAVSDYAQKLMSFNLPKILTKKCVVVYHGVKKLEFSEKQNGRFGTYVLAVSDIYVQKNYYNLIKSFKILLSKRPTLKLRVIGEKIDFRYALELNNLIIDLKLENNIIFKGKIRAPEVMEYIKNCRVFVFPSLVETFGNPLLEAMAVGVPIACSRNAAMPEVLGESGVFFNPNDECDIADKIEMLLSNSKLSLDLSEKATQRANAFSWETTANNTYQILSDASYVSSKRLKIIR